MNLIVIKVKDGGNYCPPDTCIHCGKRKYKDNLIWIEESGGYDGNPHEPGYYECKKCGGWEPIQTGSQPAETTCPHDYSYTGRCKHCGNFKPAEKK